jgi:hypothetical protein
MGGFFSRMTNAMRQGNQPDEAVRASVMHIVTTLILFGAAGFLFLGIYSWSFASWGLFGVLTLLAFAAFCSGGLLGFLFGIPKYKAQQAPTPGDAAAIDAVREDEPTYAPNTNLEEMSDWLTKVIVGAGLVGMSGLVDRFDGLTKNLATCFGEAPCAAGVVGADLLAFAILGFFAIYLLTRLYLADEFVNADPRLRQTLSRLKSLSQLDFEDLPELQRNWLARLAVAKEQGRPYVLPANFARASEDHEALRALRATGLVRPVNTRSWAAGTVVELTALGARLTPEIQQQLKPEIDAAAQESM